MLLRLGLRLGLAGSLGWGLRLGEAVRAGETAVGLARVEEGAERAQCCAGGGFHWHDGELQIREKKQ